jgi:hypothetical protein
MEARANLGKFQSAIGSTNASSSEYLMDDDATQDTEATTDDEESVDTAANLMDTIYDDAISGTLDLDDVMVSAAHASRPTGITAEQLSKTWRIDLDAAERTIGITSQHSRRADNPTLSRNYGTNDRMLRYKRIHEYFFMDTFFATKKAGK